MSGPSCQTVDFLAQWVTLSALALEKSQIRIYLIDKQHKFDLSHLKINFGLSIYPVDSAVIASNKFVFWLELAN